MARAGSENPGSPTYLSDFLSLGEMNLGFTEFCNNPFRSKSFPGHKITPFSLGRSIIHNLDPVWGATHSAVGLKVTAK